MIKKRDCWKSLMFLVVLLVFVQSISFASAINIEVEKATISDVVIAEVNKPAVFDFKIKNLGPTDNFEIYSLVGIYFSPRGTFEVLGAETKNVRVEVYPDERVRSKEGIFNFVYNIKGSTGIFEDRISVSIVKIRNLFGLSADNIIIDSDSATIYIENRENVSISDAGILLSSVFFSYNANLSFSPLEKKSFSIKIDREKTKSITAGTYKLLADISIGGVTEKAESSIKYVEKTEFTTKTEKSGWIITTERITKTNEGNVPAIADIKIQRDTFSGIFTTFNVAPERVERQGLIVTYSWAAEVLPAGKLEIAAKTNYLYPIVLVILIVAVIFIIKSYLTGDVIVRKDSSFVKTKSGEFALKIRLNVRARRAVERLTVIDRLPPVVKLYDKYGVAPEKVDEKNRKILWNVNSMSAGEQKMFSYIIYSKIGMVGMFALPLASVVYDRNGKVKEANSNSAYISVSEKKE